MKTFVHAASRAALRLRAPSVCVSVRGFCRREIGGGRAASGLSHGVGHD